MPAAEILIVEDRPTQAMRLQALLEKDGFAVTCSTCGAETLQYLKGHRPSIIVAVIIIPDFDGYEVAAEDRG